MSQIFGIEVSGIEKLTRQFAEAPKHLDEAEKRTVRRTSLEVLKNFRENVSPPNLRRRSGHLAASTNASAPFRDGLGWASAVGYREGDVSAYARVQEGVDTAGKYVDSTTIKAKKRLLAIPIGENLTPSGLARIASPKDVEGGFWLKFNAHLFFVVPQGKGKNARLRFLFLGVPSVKVKGKQGLRKAQGFARVRMREIADEEVGALVKRFLRG